MKEERGREDMQKTSDVLSSLKQTNKQTNPHTHTGIREHRFLSQSVSRERRDGEEQAGRKKGLLSRPQN